MTRQKLNPGTVDGKKLVDIQDIQIFQRWRGIVAESTSRAALLSVFMTEPLWARRFPFAAGWKPDIWPAATRTSQSSQSSSCNLSLNSFLAATVNPNQTWQHVTIIKQGLGWFFHVEQFLLDKLCVCVPACMHVCVCVRARVFACVPACM